MFLAFLHKYLLESLQFTFWTDCSRIILRDIELDGLICVTFSDIGHFNAYVKALARFGNLKRTEFKSGIRESESERIERFCIGIAPVAHEYTLGIGAWHYGVASL